MRQKRKLIFFSRRKSKHGYISLDKNRYDQYTILLKAILWHHRNKVTMSIKSPVAWDRVRAVLMDVVINNAWMWEKPGKMNSAILVLSSGKGFTCHGSKIQQCAFLTTANLKNIVHLFYLCIVIFLLFHLVYKTLKMSQFLKAPLSGKKSLLFRNLSS